MSNSPILFTRKHFVLSKPFKATVDLEEREKRETASSSEEMREGAQDDNEIDSIKRENGDESKSNFQSSLEPVWQTY